jgi:hypothetical protein
VDRNYDLFEKYPDGSLMWNTLTPGSFKIVYGWRVPHEVTRYFTFLAFSALIFAHRAFANRESFARTAADMVCLMLLTLGALVCAEDTAIFPLPFKAAIAPRTAVNCRCNFDSSCLNAPIMSMKPPVNIKHCGVSKYKDLVAATICCECYIRLFSQ